MKLPFAHIETQRLILRPPELQDFDDFAVFCASDRSRYVGGPGVDRRNSWRAFAHITGHWVLRDFGTFAITRKGDDTALGFVGPWRPEGWPEREIGWSIWNEADEGHGIAFEASMASCAHAFDVLDWDTAVSYIDPDNARSILLAERMGCVLDTAATPLDEGDLVYRHPAPDTDGNPEAYS